MEGNKWKLERNVVSQVSVGLCPMPSASARLYDPIPFLKDFLGTYQKWQKLVWNGENVVSTVKMSSSSGGFAPDPQDSALWNNQKCKETNENLLEMLCLKYQLGLHVICHQLRPDYDSTSFIKAMPAICHCQKWQKTSVKWLEFDVWNVNMPCPQTINEYPMELIRNGMK